jgi:hypothetical protein
LEWLYWDWDYVRGARRNGSSRKGCYLYHRSEQDVSARALAGAIDIHVHSHPDNRPRSLDALDAAGQAKAHGMRAIVLKNHDDPGNPAGPCP